jgi:ketosteroid isomerase-like protein
LQIADAVKIRFETSETNLDIVARQYERFNQRRIKAMIEALDPDVVFEPGPEAGPYRTTCIGRDEVKCFFKRLRKTVRKFQAQPLRVLEQGHEVFVLVRMSGKFKGGIEAWLPVIHCWTISEGKIVRWRSTPGRGKSFEAAVLELLAADSVEPAVMSDELAHVRASS